MCAGEELLHKVRRRTKNQEPLRRKGPFGRKDRRRKREEKEIVPNRFSRRKLRQRKRERVAAAAAH